MTACGATFIPSTSSSFFGILTTPIPNGIPQGYMLQITPQYDDRSHVTGALFEMANNGQTIGSLCLCRGGLQLLFTSRTNLHWLPIASRLVFDDCLSG
jgi:hypothetical protein